MTLCICQQVYLVCAAKLACESLQSPCSAALPRCLRCLPQRELIVCSLMLWLMGETSLAARFRAAAAACRAPAWHPQWWQGQSACWPAWCQKSTGKNDPLLCLRLWPAQQSEARQSTTSWPASLKFEAERKWVST